MEEWRGLVSSFYSSGDGRLQNELVERMRRTESVQIAVQVLQREEHDAFLLYFAGLVLEDAARRRFEALDSSLLMNAALARLTRPTADQPFVRAKIVRALVELGKRQWLTELGQTGEDSPFLNQMLQSAQQSFVGVEVLAVLVTDATAASKTDLLTSQKAALRRAISAAAPRLVQVLDTGLKTAGDAHGSVITQVVSSVEAIALEEGPVAAVPAINILWNLSLAHDKDLTARSALEALVSLSEQPRALKGVPVTQILGQMLEHVSLVLDIATERLNQQKVDQYSFLVLTYAGAVLQRHTTLCVTRADLASKLDGILGRLIHITSSNQDTLLVQQLFSRSLDVWTSILTEIHEGVLGNDANAKATAERLHSGLFSLVHICLARMLLSTNSPTLTQLEYWSMREERDSELQAEKDETLLEAVQSEDETERVVSDRSMFREKCLKTVTDVCRLYENAISEPVGQFIQSQMSGSLCDEDSAILLELAMEISPYLEADSTTARGLLELVVQMVLNDRAIAVVDIGFSALMAMAPVLFALPTDSRRAVISSIQQRILSLITEPGCPAIAIVSASSFLMLLSNSVRTGELGQYAGLKPLHILGCSQPRAARNLLVAAMQSVFLIGDSLDSGKLPDAEWETRVATFAPFLAQILEPYDQATVELSKAQLQDETRHRCSEAICRGAGLLETVFQEIHDEKSSPKAAIWATCEKYVTNSAEHTLQASSVQSTGYATAAVLKFLGVCFTSVRHKCGDLPRRVIESGLQLVGDSKQHLSAESRLIISKSLLKLILAELSSGAPSNTENLVGPIGQLCGLYAGADSDLQIIAIEVAECCLVRHWRWYFPQDSALNALQGSVGGDTGSLDGHLAEFNQVVEFLVRSLESEERSVYQRATEALLTTNRSRRLFSRPSFQESGAIAACLIRLFAALTSRRHDPAREVTLKAVFSLAQPNMSWFLHGGLEHSLSGGVENPVAKQTCGQFGQNLTDENSFTRGVEAVLNDFAFYTRLESPGLTE